MQSQGREQALGCAEKLLVVLRCPFPFCRLPPVHKQEL